MKVLYDYQTFAEQEYGGISRYFYELIRRYPLHGGVSPELSLKYSNNIHLASGKLGSFRSFFKGFNFKGKRRMLLALNRAAAVKALAKGEFDVFHPTYYDPYFLGHCRKPFVLTVYDMIHERFSEVFPGCDRTSSRKRDLCGKASRIITISASTKKDLVDIFGVPPEKIDVVHLANSLDPADFSSMPLPEKYLLFVGNRGGYKGFAAALEAMMALSALRGDLFLVCAGGGPFTPAELAEIGRTGLGEKVVRVSVDDRRLVYAYRNAVCLVFPSLCEGFGLPVLEAFACGCPVVAASAGALPEVAGDAALYFPPGDNDGLISSLRRLLSDPDLRRELSSRGERRLRSFSWEKCARETADVYAKTVSPVAKGEVWE